MDGLHRRSGLGKNSRYTVMNSVLYLDERYVAVLSPSGMGDGYGGYDWANGRFICVHRANRD